MRLRREGGRGGRDREAAMTSKREKGDDDDKDNDGFKEL